jgi:transposase
MLDSEGIPDMALQVYPSDLTDAEWEAIAPLIPPAKPGGRPRLVEIRRRLSVLAATAATEAPHPRSIGEPGYESGFHVLPRR